MKTDIAWAELHAPLFLAGTNLGQKLDPAKRSGIDMQYDEEKRHLFVSYNKHTARIPETSVLSMVEGKFVARKERPAAKVENPGMSWPEHAQVSGPGEIQAVVAQRNEASRIAAPQASRPMLDPAQVSTPQSHVFAGPGGGQTGQDEVKRGPGRPSKTK